MKTKILKGLKILWMIILPIILALGFSFGCFMCMWDIWKFPLWLAISISVLISAGCVFIVGKWVKLW